MKSEIKISREKEFVGKRLRLSFAANETFELRRGFMPEKAEFRIYIGQSPAFCANRREI